MSGFDLVVHLTVSLGPLSVFLQQKKLRSSENTQSSTFAHSRGRSSSPSQEKHHHHRQRKVRSADSVCRTAVVKPQRRRSQLLTCVFVCVKEGVSLSLCERVHLFSLFLCVGESVTFCLFCIDFVATKT